MKFCTISSGSKGNMLYIETKQTKVILDVGISFKEATNRINNKEIDFENVDAIVISHEHSDHVKFLGTFLKKTKAILYINELSFDNLSNTVKNSLGDIKVKFIEENTKYKIKDLEILTMKLSHDSANIFGFIFINDDKRLAYITDTGFLPLQYINILKDIDALIIECNHDITMLMESDRHLQLKHRILSPKGHMSNHICMQILSTILNERHKIVLLAHLSEDCNSIEIVQRDVIDEVKKISNTEIEIASQYEASELYQI
ncbi:MAG: MBL fold metallo-hydrolase [Bacilli bacterium]|nr:MBL fold metallo-hydrolase [Bacilli bacterium]